MASAAIASTLRAHISATSVSKMSAKDRAPFTPPKQNWAVVACVWPGGPCPAKQIGLNIIGCFETQLQAKKYIDLLVKKYKWDWHNLARVQMNVFLPYPPPSADVAGTYAEETVEKIMTAGKQRIMEQDDAFEAHVQECRQAEEEARAKALAGRDQVETEDASVYLAQEAEKRKQKEEELKQKYEEQCAVDRVKATLLKQAQERDKQALAELADKTNDIWAKQKAQQQQKPPTKPKYKCVLGKSQRERPVGQLKQVQLPKPK
jgi:hypothetical protein